jgi:1,4-dihydroxy-2-naphthoyl-CoA hydrolase
MRLDKNNIRERIKDTFMDTLQLTFIENDDPDTVEATMPVGRFNCQTMGVLHGGATIALAETVAGIGSNLMCAEDEGCFGIQISANHISSAKLGDVVKGIATLIHKGRSSHVWNVDVISVNTGKLISSIRVTNFVVKNKK